MKPYIAQTVADLRVEHTRLGEMITLLEVYGTASDPTAPAVPEQHPQTPAAGNDPPGRRRVSKTEPVYRPRAATGAKQLVVEAIAALPEPFTIDDVRNYVLKHHPNYACGKSSFGVAICNLREAGVIRDVGKKVPGKFGPIMAYKKDPNWRPPGKPSVKEEAYRKLREEIPAPPHVTD